MAGGTRPWDIFFFANEKLSYVVKVPATFSGTRSNGQDYNRQGWVPMDNPFRLRATMTPAQRDIALKQAVHGRYPNRILSEVSEERVTIREGAWFIAEMTTGPPEGGGLPETSVVERQLGMKPVLASLPFPEAICPIAFEEHHDKLYCPRQLAAVLNKDLEAVCHELDEMNGTAWRQGGCTGRMVFDFCRRRGFGCTCLHGDKVIEVLPRRSPVVFSVWESHA